MLEGYEIKYGVIHQKEHKPFNYSSAYVKAYNALDGEAMSNIRFNNIVNSIGFIPHSILDYGFGNGAFLYKCLEEDVECYAYDIAPEPPPNGVKHIKEMSEIDYVDVVTFFDSLEHTEDIIETMNSLPKHKYICVTVPCCKEYNSENFDEWFKTWFHRKQDEHLYAFSITALISFMLNLGYSFVNLNSCEDIIRKPIDSYPNTVTAIFRKL